MYVTYGMNLIDMTHLVVLIVEYINIYDMIDISLIMKRLKLWTSVDCGRWIGPTGLMGGVDWKKIKAMESKLNIVKA